MATSKDYKDFILVKTYKNIDYNKIYRLDN